MQRRRLLVLLGTEKGLKFRHSGYLRFIPSVSEDGAAIVEERWIFSHAKKAARIRGHRECSGLVIEHLIQNGIISNYMAAFGVTMGTGSSRE